MLFTLPSLLFTTPEIRRRAACSSRLAEIALEAPPIGSLFAFSVYLGKHLVLEFVVAGIRRPRRASTSLDHSIASHEEPIVLRCGDWHPARLIWDGSQLTKRWPATLQRNDLPKSDVGNVSRARGLDDYAGDGRAKYERRAIDRCLHRLGRLTALARRCRRRQRNEN